MRSNLAAHFMAMAAMQAASLRMVSEAVREPEPEQVNSSPKLIDPIIESRQVRRARERRERKAVRP